MSRRVAVTGLGAVSSLGLGVGSFWHGLVDGVQAVRARPSLSALGLGELPLGVVRLVEDPDDEGSALLSGVARASTMAECAATEALLDAGWQSAAPPLGLCVGTTLGEKVPWIARLRGQATGAGEGFGPAAPALPLAWSRGVQQLRVVSAACASSNAALGVGLDWIRAGRCEAVLCGGVDSLQEFVIAGFTALRAQSPSPCRPFDAERAGLNLGEGAAFLLLEAETHARARGQRIRAYVDGVGLSCDASHMTGPDREGRGATRAMRAALDDAGFSPESIAFVSTHGTATRFNDLMEAQALKGLFGARAAAVPVNSIKGSIGHALGAAGALEAVMAVRVLEEQLIPPTAGHVKLDEDIKLDVVAGAPRRTRVRRVLSTSSGFGGLNAALVFSDGPIADRGGAK